MFVSKNVRVYQFFSFQCLLVCALPSLRLQSFQVLPSSNLGAVHSVSGANQLFLLSWCRRGGLQGRCFDSLLSIATMSLPASLQGVLFARSNRLSNVSLGLPGEMLDGLVTLYMT